MIPLSRGCQLQAGRGGSSAADFRALQIISKHIRVTKAGHVTRQAYFALILLITSLRKGGRRGEAQGGRLGPGDAHISAAEIAKALSILPEHLPCPGGARSSFQATERCREHIGETCDPGQFKGHRKRLLLQNQGSFFQRKAGNLARKLPGWEMPSRDLLFPHSANIC